MGLIAPGRYVAPPGINGHRFGLFSVANMPDDSERWQLGVEYEPLEGRIADLRASECVDEYMDTIVPPTVPDPVDGIPFVVVGGYNCKATSRPVEEAEERARLALIGGEERAVEEALMTAAVQNGPAFPGATLIAGGDAVSLTEAFSQFERLSGINYHSAGVIHMPRSLASFTGDLGLHQREGQRLETMLGTPVVAGAGYDSKNQSPTGVEPVGRERFIYLTQSVTVRRGEIWLSPDPESYIDKANNDYVILASRDYLVTFGGPVFAVKIDLSLFDDCPCAAAE